MGLPRRQNLRKEACWSISNITAGNREQIQECINSGVIGVALAFTDLEMALLDVR